MIRLLRQLIPANVFALLVTEAALTATCFVLASYVLLDVDPSVYLLYDGGWWRIGFIVVTVLAGFYLHDLYSNLRVTSRILLLQQGLQVIGITFLVQALLSYASPEWILPRWIMVLGGGFSLIALVNWRIFYGTFVMHAMTEVRVLFVGTNPLVREIVQHYNEHSELGFTVLGYLDEDGAGQNTLSGAARLGGIQDLLRVVDQTKPDRLVIGLLERRRQLPTPELLNLRLSGLRIDEAATAFEATFRRVSLSELRPAQLIFASELGPGPGIVQLQSLYSVLLGLLGTALCAPLMLVVAVAVKLSSAGPVLYRQERVGLLGSTFVLYKFRSMYLDAEDRTGAVWAVRDDPRITPLGRWLRRLRLDELPQFFNVLRGEMSIVGPRPERPEFVRTLAEQIPFYRQRHCIKPGITGWAQINHKYGDTIEDSVRKLEFDLYYIKNLSLALDAYIIFHTGKTMLLSRGAQ